MTLVRVWLVVVMMGVGVLVRSVPMIMVVHQLLGYVGE